MIPIHCIVVHISTSFSRTRLLRYWILLYDGIIVDSSIVVYSGVYNIQIPSSRVSVSPLLNQIYIPEVCRLWLAWNGCLHDLTNSNAVSPSAEAVEIAYYHSRPHLLRLGDQHYCQRSLSKILSGPSSTLRRVGCRQLHDHLQN